MACRECHFSKVKCDRVFPCSRCVRLNKVCVLHESRQGQGRGKGGVAGAFKKNNKKKKAKHQERSNCSRNKKLKTTHPHPYCSANRSSIASGSDSGSDSSTRSHSPMPATTSPENILLAIKTGNNNSNNERDKKATTKATDETRFTTTEAAATASTTTNTTTTTTNSNKKKAAEKISEDQSIGKGIKGLPANHYGLKCLLRSFVALAMRRRNLSLLERACSIATQCGMTMDDLLCETNTQRGMDFLYPILLTPSVEQKVVGDRIPWNEIPPNLLQAIGCAGANEKGGANIAHRWIWVREIRRGISRFTVTPAFERDIVPWKHMQSTYLANQKSVVELFLQPSDITKHTNAFAYQVSLFKTPDTKWTPCTMKMKVKLKRPLPGTTDNVMDVDQILCSAILNLDHDIHIWEYIPRHYNLLQHHQHQQQQQEIKQKERQQQQQTSNNKVADTANVTATATIANDHETSKKDGATTIASSSNIAAETTKTGDTAQAVAISSNATDEDEHEYDPLLQAAITSDLNQLVEQEMPCLTNLDETLNDGDCDEALDFFFSILQ